MPTSLLFDLSTIDLDHVAFDIGRIREMNQQRFEMELLDAIVHCDLEQCVVVGRKDLREDEWWARGHLPGNPLFPGCLQIEAAAQACSVFYRAYFKEDAAPFFGFGGIEGARFRAAVRPGARFYVISRKHVLRRRSSIFDVQGIVDGRIVFDGRIIGVAMSGEGSAAADA